MRDYCVCQTGMGEASERSKMNAAMLMTVLRRTWGYSRSKSKSGGRICSRSLSWSRSRLQGRSGSRGRSRSGSWDKSWSGKRWQDME